MDFDQFFIVIVAIIGLAVLWTILRAIFRLTARLFALGCVVILALVAIGCLIFWLV